MSAGSTNALSSDAMKDGTYLLLLSYQGYDSVTGNASTWLFGQDNTSIHTSLRTTVYGVPGYAIGTVDDAAPNTAALLTANSYYLSHVELPTVRWRSAGTGSGVLPANIEIVWGSDMPTAGASASTVVTCKLVKMASY